MNFRASQLLNSKRLILYKVNYNYNTTEIKEFIFKSI